MTLSFKQQLGAAFIGLPLAVGTVMADEGGVSFWLPGQFSSFAAVPGDPGWSMAGVYYHNSSDAGGGRETIRGGRVTAGVEADADLIFLAPSYTFTEPVLGGQAAIQVTGLFGRMKIDVDATLTGPGGGVLSGSESDTRTGVGDLYPMGTLKWNHGVHNFMSYVMAGVPVGAYDKNALANLGTNHWSVDAGGGYTYLDTKTGREFSAVLGFTYNGENSDTNYQNGTSAHFDWAASQFLSESLHIGLVGYFYHQLSGDSGDGAVLGDFKSEVSAIGPQVGWFLPIVGKKSYLNLKAYKEFDAKNRTEGWNAWVTLAVPLGSGK